MGLARGKRPFGLDRPGAGVKGGLTQRTLVASGLLALVVGTAFTVLLLSIIGLREAERSALRSEEVLVTANRLERLLVDAETGLRGYLITGRDEFLQPWQTARAAFTGQAATLQRLLAGNPEQLNRARQITQAGNSYIEDYTVSLLDLARRDLPAARTVTANAEGKRRLDALRAGFDRLIATERRLARERQSSSDAAANHAIAAAVCGLAGSTLLIGLFTAYLRRAIVRPVRQVAEMAGRLAAGNLDARLPERGVGEIGMLEHSFNTMADSLQDSRDELASSRARIVAAADQARRRIERDLHDGTQQRLVSLVLDLRAAEANAPHELAELREQLDHVADELAAATDDLRELSRGIHPAILSEGGLAPALKALARRSGVPVELEVDVPARLPEQLEVAAYYVVSEALANTVKHAHASVVQVDIRARAEGLRLSLRDDGVGGATPGRGSGLIGLTDRVHALGGTITVTSPQGHGTELLVNLPVDDR